MSPILPLAILLVALVAVAAHAVRLHRLQRRGEWALREAEAARARAEQRVHTLVERSAYGVCTVSRDGTIVEANLSLARMLGFETAEELVGTGIAGVFAEPCERERMLAQADAGALPDWVEVEWRRRGGATFPVRLSERAERDDAGRVVSCTAIVEDVTMRRRHEEAQRRSERLTALGRLLAGTAHELNNPLAAVSGFSQLLLRGDLPLEARQALETIDREANRAAAVVRELLAFSRGPDRAPGAAAQEYDLNAVARYVARARRYALESLGIRLELALAAQPLHVNAARTELEQVLLNLVTNAEQALEAHAERQRVADGPRAVAQGRVVLRSAVHDGRAVLEVEDNGPGIAAADLPLVWDPFWTTKGEGEGTGLGLSIVHEMVARMGGLVDVESTPGRGARFRVELPLAAPRPEPDAGAEAGTPRRDGSAARPRDVLVADDDGVTADFVTRLLSARGHAAVAALDAAGALALAAQGYDVAVVAASLAGSAVDGTSLLERMRRLPGAAESRIVLLADAPGGAPVSASHAELADAVIGKPLDVAQLRRTVESV